MASVLLGRAACPECGFAAAHVKRSEKCHYRYCPECGSQHYAKSQRQIDDLLSKMRPESGGPVPDKSATPTGTGSATPPPAAPPAVPVPPPVVKPRHGLGLFQ
ncbi:hypothetical protein HUU62_04325 [Rhodoferax sp. 4810]|nr:hypothetical protein [Rhodoferax jenense]